MSKGIVTEQFWLENFSQLLPQAKSILNAPPVVGGNPQDKITALLIIACADLHQRLHATEAKDAPRVVLAS